MIQDNVIHLTSDTFNDTISKDVVLVDFFADWCGPCKMLAPFIEQLANQYDGKAKIAKLNVDECQDIAMQFGVMSIPTVIIFKNGEQVEQFVGVQDAGVYEDALNKAIG